MGMRKGVSIAEEEIDLTRIDRAGLLPDKYNYLKIENIFSGKIIGSEKLFSLEVALLTKQPSVPLISSFLPCLRWKAT